MACRFARPVDDAAVVLSEAAGRARANGRRRCDGADDAANRAHRAERADATVDLILARDLAWAVDDAGVVLAKALRITWACWWRRGEAGHFAVGRTDPCEGADATVELRAADGLARPVLIAQEELGDACSLALQGRRRRRERWRWREWWHLREINDARTRTSGADHLRDRTTNR